MEEQYYPDKKDEIPKISFDMLDKPETREVIGEFEKKDVVFEMTSDERNELFKKAKPVMLAMGITESQIEDASERINYFTKEKVGVLGPLSRFETVLEIERLMRILTGNKKINDREIIYVRKKFFDDHADDLLETLRVIHMGLLEDEEKVDVLVKKEKLSRDEYKKFTDVENRTPKFVFALCKRLGGPYGIEIDTASPEVQKAIDGAKKQLFKASEKIIDNLDKGNDDKK